MGSHGFRGVIGAFIAGSLIFSSSAAAAATTAIDQQVNPWAALTAMSGGAPAAAMCGAAATAAALQGPTGCVLPIMDAVPPPPVAGPPPPVPVEAAVPSAGISPLLLGLLALAVFVGAAVALSGHHHHGNSPA
jgi:hypothetical protein